MTINDRIEDFDNLFNLYDRIIQLDESIRFGFTYCRFLRQNAVAVLGCIAHELKQRGLEVDFEWETMSWPVKTNLAQNGFMNIFGGRRTPWEGNSIPYRQDHIPLKDDLVKYLKEYWLGRGWINISPKLTNEIVGIVWEIYENAFEHGKSSIGVISCGQHYPQLNELKLTVVDLGIGIPQNVRGYMNNFEIPSNLALRWAFKRGTSTKPSGRGIGLDLLKDFINKNNGQLEIYSNDGLVRISDGEIYQHHYPSFNGTLVNITLKCDEKMYILASELSKKRLFSGDV